MPDLAVRYSEACTRAGIAALAAAAIAVTFAQRLGVVEPLDAFGRYVTSREILKLALNELVASPYWPQLIAQIGGDGSLGESATLGQLSSLECVRSSKGNHVRPVRSQESALSVSKNFDAAPISAAVAQPEDLALPLPPSELKIETVEPCPGLRDIYLALDNVGFDLGIETARRLSREADLELYGWQVVRNRIYEKASARSASTSSVLRAGFDGRHSVLTISDLRELNSHPHLTQSQYTTLANSLLLVVTPYAAVNQGANSASLLVQAALFVFVAYFALNARAAAIAGALRESGSLFELLTRDTWGRGFIALLMPLPALAAAYLAFNMTGIERIAGVVLALGTIGLTTMASLILWANRGSMK